ncbi:MAG: caspase family protein [bacterium]
MKPQNIISLAGFLAALNIIAAAAAAVGCAREVSPGSAATVPELFLTQKLPLNVALLVSDAEREKKRSASFVYGMTPIASEFTLGSTFENVLQASFSQVFEHVTIVRGRPAPRKFDLTLIPESLDLKWTTFGPFVVGLEAVMTGDLRVLDHLGAHQFSTLRAEGKASGQPPTPANVRAESSTVMSQAIASLARRWGEQLANSDELKQYAAGVGQLTTSTAGVAAPKVSQGVVIQLSYPSEGARVTEEMVTLIGVATTPRGIRRVELLVNGASFPVSRDVRVQATGIQSHPFTASVPLRAGKNVIALTATDTTGATSQAVRTVHREIIEPAAVTPTVAATGERWAVVIGIDQYQDPSILTLKYAGNDAEAIFKLLTTKAGVKPVNARLLLNQQATQRAIREVLGDFLYRKALKEDEVIIYYAGHGTTESDAGAEGGLAKYLVPWDADPQRLFSTAIPMDEIDRVFGRLPARKVLLIQDTCFSGGAGGRTFLAKGMRVRATGLTDRFLHELSQKEGRMILTASDVNQVSIEDPAVGHGIFTHYLMQALESGAADLDRDGAITVREVHLYLQRKVHEHSRGAQTPQLYNIGDMVLIRGGK